MNTASKLFLLILVFLLCDYPIFCQNNKIISIQKTTCFGPCPAFTMDILKNCKVILNAEQFVDIGHGEFKSKLSKIQYDEIVDQFRQSGFFELDDAYRSNASDLPTTYFYFKDQGRSKTVEVYGNWPEDLVKVDQKIAHLIKALKWEKVRSSKNDSDN